MTAKRIHGFSHVGAALAAAFVPPTPSSAESTTGRGRPPTRASAARHGFTLVELLVVIGIISVLISMLLPALNKARQAAKQIACASNIKQVLMAAQMYANDNKQFVVFGSGNSVASEQWPQLLIDCKYLQADSPYGQFSKVLRCPAAYDPVARAYYRTQYGINYRHTFGWPQTAIGATQKWTQIRHPQETVLFADCRYGNYTYASYTTVFSGNADGTPYGNPFLDANVPDYRHAGKTANFGFFDGHVEAATAKKAASPQCYVWWYGLEGLL